MGVLFLVKRALKIWSDSLQKCNGHREKVSRTVVKMAWPFLVGGVICLVNSVNERDLNLLNTYVVFEPRASS